MTMNNRPIEDPRLQKALDEIKRVYARYGMAGAAMVIAEDEGAFTYALHAPWSAIRHDPSTPLGWRLRAISSEDGKAKTEARVLGAAHTVCQLLDFAVQTEAWMTDLQKIMQDGGIDFVHTPFGGQPLPRIFGDLPPPTRDKGDEDR